MSVECSECEHDLRGGHSPDCSRYEPPKDAIYSNGKVFSAQFEKVKQTTPEGGKFFPAVSTITVIDGVQVCIAATSAQGLQKVLEHIRPNVMFDPSLFQDIELHGAKHGKS